MFTDDVNDVLNIGRNGHYFKLDLYTKDWNNQGKSLLTAFEIERQLQRICDIADSK